MLSAANSSIKLIVFDLDGVLVDSREMHYEALNRALASIDPKFVIGREEHLAVYDGRPTSTKLRMLTESKGLPVELHNQVWKLKQEMTVDVINDTYRFDDRLRSILKELKMRGFTLFCASNSIFNTLKLILLRKGVIEYFDYFVSCEDVIHPKPAPDIYIQCCIRGGVSPKQTLILEDSHIGRKAALMSGSHLLPIDVPSSVTLELITSRIIHINHEAALMNPPKMIPSGYNIVIPMANSSDSHKLAGSPFPLPLIEVDAKPMIQLALENTGINGRYIFVVSRSDYDSYNYKTLLRLLAPGCEILIAEEPTQGQSCTVMLAEKLIDNDQPLLIMNLMRFIEWDIPAFVKETKRDDLDGVIATFKNTHPRFSYVVVDEPSGTITRAEEKKVISDNATCGVYFWKRGKDFCKYARESFHLDLSTHEQFFVSKVYDVGIQKGLVVRPFMCKKMWPLNTSKDLEQYYSARKNGLIRH